MWALRLLCTFLSGLVVSAGSLEVGVPERFLRPRNFNPHPYVEGELPLEETEDLRTHLAPGYFRENLPQLPDHPYALFKRPLSRGDDGRAPIQFPQVPPEANIPAHRQRLKPADVKHPLNLGVIRQQQLFSPQSLKPDKKYAFSYSVLDRSSGDDFSHSQLGSGGQTKGEYRVKLPDGRLQVVSYTADHRGYRADVRYDEDNSVDPGVTAAKYSQQPPDVFRYSPPPAPSGILHHRAQPIPLQIHLPKPAYKTLLLDYDEVTARPLRDHTPIHEEQEDYGDYRENTVSSTPSYQIGVRPDLVQRLPTFQEIGERAGPVKFPPTPPPTQQEEERFVGSSPSTGYPESGPSSPSPDSVLYFTTPSPVKLFLGSDGHVYSQKK